MRGGENLWSITVTDWMHKEDREEEKARWVYEREPTAPGCQRHPHKDLFFKKALKCLHLHLLRHDAPGTLPTEAERVLEAKNVKCIAIFIVCGPLKFREISLAFTVEEIFSVRMTCCERWRFLSARTSKLCSGNYNHRKKEPSKGNVDRLTSPAWSNMGSQ